MNATETAWFRQSYELDRQAREEADARERAWIARMERMLRATRKAAEQAAAPAATSGNGWRVLAHPDVPHMELETLAQHVWAVAFHAIPWPEGWRVRWANCGAALGLCDRDAKLILIAAHRSPRELFKTILHELVHVTHPNELHGVGFTETLKRVERHVLQDMPASDATWHREPVKWGSMSSEPEDGAPVPRTAALRNLDLARKALAAAGGSPPRDHDGQPMVWQSGPRLFGWWPRDDSKASLPRPRGQLGRPLVELEARQRSIGIRIRHERRDAELCAERELIDGASPMAWRWARMFSLGEPWPGVDATDAQRMGWRLMNRGLVSLRRG